MKGNKEHVIYGMHPLLEAIASGKDIEKVMIQKGIRGDLFQTLIRQLREAEIPFRILPSERFEPYKTKNHQGVIAFLSEITYQDITQLLPTIYEAGVSPFILVLDRITDVRNFGALARTAACAGVHAIVIPEKGSALINQDAIKTSSGALLNLPVCRTPNLLNTLKYLKNCGLMLCSISEKGGELFYQVNMEGPIAILLGSEENGISTELLKISDSIAYIPMQGTIASLNVSVAGALAMYERVRQTQIGK